MCAPPGVAVLTPHLDMANARVEFADGAVAKVTASRIARERVRRLRMFQPNGYFSLDLAARAAENSCGSRTGWIPAPGDRARGDRGADVR